VRQIGARVDPNAAARSGDSYCTVPTVVPLWCRCGAPGLGQAEIEIFTRPSLPRKYGRLDVAVHYARLVAADNPSHTCEAIFRDSLMARSPERMRLSSVCPDTSSMAMNVRPSCSPRSCTVTMLGWFKAAAALARARSDF